MERAAPPRASPSILAMTKPVRSRTRSKPSAIRTASCPVMASATRRISRGLSTSLSRASSSMSGRSICSLPAVSTMRTAALARRASRCAPAATATGSVAPSSWWTGTPTLPAQHPQLLDGRGAMEVAGREADGPSLPAEPPGQLGRGRGLPGPLQSHQHDDGGGHRRPLQRVLALRADQPRQLVVHDLDDLLPGRHGLEHPLAHRLLLNAVQELPRDPEVDIGLQEGSAHLPQAFPDHGFGEEPALAKTPQNPVQLPAQVFKHRCPQRRRYSL